MRLIPVFCFVLILVFCILPGSVEAQSSIDEAYASLMAGDYLKARRMYEERLQVSDSLQTMNVVYYADTYLAKGDYEEGLKVVSGLVSESEVSNNPFILHARGLFFDYMGRYQEAERAYFSSAELKNDLWRNILALGELLEKTGRYSQANEAFNYIYRPFKNNEFRTAEDLGVAARAAAFIGEFRDANAAFSTAYQLDLNHVRNLHWWGELFRVKYNDTDAQRTLEEALKLNAEYAPIYTALAKAVQGFGQKEKLARKALEKNPRHVDAFAVLASLNILDGLYDQATDLLNEALKINPSHVEVLAHLATIHFLRGEMEIYEEIEQRVLSINPRAGLFYITLARNCDLKFRYPDAVRFGELAVQVDRRNPEAYAQLGTSLLRLGRSDEAKRYLDFSFEADPYNLFVGNMLTLIDEFEDFALLHSEHFSLLIHNDERDALGPAILEIAEESYAELSTRYSYEPSQRILLEAYNDPDDFAVRIAGIPHLGLLGVSFGNVLAINTPRSMEANSYNWARTLWHELVHSISIGLSDYRMPRWFAEGLAVYEEQRARPEWGREMQINFLLAFEQEKLLPLTEMDRGFTRPTFPGQILLSYYHASRVIDYIVGAYGFDAIVEILKSFASGKTDSESVQDVLGVSLEELDEAFVRELQQERNDLAVVLRGMPNPFEEEPASNPLNGVGSFFQNAFLKELNSGFEELKAGEYTEAEKHFLKSLALYDKYTEPGNPYEGLAAVYRAQGDNEKLSGILERYLKITEYGSEEAIELAHLLEEEGDLAASMYYYERSLQVSPYSNEVQTRLAEIYTGKELYDKAVQSRLAVLGLNPIDRADAYYQYALSLYAANRLPESKRAVLQSLELAPGFREAQKLLLQLVEQ